VEKSRKRNRANQCCLGGDVLEAGVVYNGTSSYGETWSM